MIAKKYALILVILPIFLLSLITAIVPVQAPLPAPSVKVYTEQPSYPSVGVGSRFWVYFIIEMNGIPNDHPTDGIMGWGLLLQVDPNVLWPRIVRTSASGYALYDWVDDSQLTWPITPYPTAVSSIDPATGEVSVSENFLPAPTDLDGNAVGMGDAYSGRRLFAVYIESLNATQPCLINIVKGNYQTRDGVWHAFDIMTDAQYGEPSATYLTNQDAALDLKSPIGSTWHELWPRYSNMMTLTSWEDNGDGVLSPSDQIDMLNHTDNWLYWWHVDAVTVTIHWTFKDGPFQGELGAAETAYTPDVLEIGGDPVGTGWHQIYPEFSRPFRITSWIDDNGDQVFNPSDQFDFVYEDDATVYYAHLDSVTIDIILSFKYKEPPIPEFPLGLGLMIAIAPAIPIMYLWRTRKKVTAK